MNMKMKLPNEITEALLSDTKLKNNKLDLSFKKSKVLIGHPIYKVSNKLSFYNNAIIIHKSVNLDTNSKELNQFSHTKQNVKEINKFNGPVYILLTEFQNKIIKSAKLLLINNIQLKSDKPKSYGKQMKDNKYRYSFEVIEEHTISYNNRVHNSQLDEKNKNKELSKIHRKILHLSTKNDNQLVTRLNTIFRFLPFFTKKLSTSLFFTKADFAGFNDFNDIKCFYKDLDLLEKDLEEKNNNNIKIDIIKDITNHINNFLIKYKIDLYTAKKLTESQKKKSNQIHNFYANTDMIDSSEIYYDEEKNKNNKDKTISVKFNGIGEYKLRIGTFQNNNKPNGNIYAELIDTKLGITLGKLTPRILTELDKDIIIDDYKDHNQIINAFLNSKKENLDLYFSLQSGKLLKVKTIY